MAPFAPTSLVLHLQVDLLELPRLASAVEQFLARNGLPEDLARRMNLALDELLANVMHHGLAHRMDGTLQAADALPEIEVRLDLADDRLIAEIRDQGTPFNPLERPDPDVGAPLEERAVGGLGIYLARQMMDVIRYSRADGRNCLTLIKLLPGAGIS